MAEVAKPTTLATQLSLVILVRWQAFRNGLRSHSEKAHVAGSFAIGLIFTVGIFGVSAGLCFGSYLIARDGNWLTLSLLFWGIFMTWQIVPVLSTEMNPGFDGRNLLRFPLRFSAFFLMSAAYGFADPFALAGILWHAAIGVGVSIARPDLAGWAALALAISILMNVMFNRLVFSWLERLLSKRRLREIATVLFVLIFISIQFSGLIIHRWGRTLGNAVESTSTVWRALPPALAGTTIEHAAREEPAAAVRTVGLLGIYAVLFGALFASRVRAQFTGEDLGESAAPVRQQSIAKRIPAAAGVESAPATHVSQSTGDFSGIVSPQVAAIFGKEVRYFYRNTMMMMNAFLPLILIAFFVMSSSMPGRQGSSSVFGKFGGGYAYPAAVAYILLLMMNFCPNNLAYEGRGVERLFLAPVNFRDVMLGKNLFHGALLACEALLALVVVSVMGHPPTVIIALATWTGLLFAALLHLATGNWLSLQFPRRFEFGVRRQRPSGLTMLIFFGLLFGEIAAMAGAAALCVWFVGVWLLPIVYGAMSLAALVVYRLILEGTTRQAIVQRDTLLEQLAK